jgi:hypothetical protein
MDIYYKFLVVERNNLYLKKIEILFELNDCYYKIII